MPQRGDDDSEECENMTEVLDVRKMRILQAIVDDYILTASPVGSRTLSKRDDIELSPATIRNETLRSSVFLNSRIRVRAGFRAKKLTDST